MESFSLKNHQNKCRLCFKTLNKRGKHVQITQDIGNKFNAITQIHLKSSPNYSNQICLNCDKELSDFTAFKSNLVERQSKLYTEYPDDNFVKPESNCEILQINIKQEQETEVDPGHSDDDNGIDDSLELLRCNMGTLEESVDESNIEKPKKKRGGSKPRGGRTQKQRQLCPDCGCHVLSLRRHWRLRHSKIINFICDLCGYGSLMRHSLVTHMTNRHQPKEARLKFRCEICDFETVNRAYLGVHAKSHSLEPSEFICHCGKDFLSKHLLAQHISLVHERDYKFKCPYCPRTYPYRKSQREHVMTQHTKKDIRDMICTICSSAFVTEFKLNRHIKEVHTEGTIPCEFEGCSKRFHKNSKLKRHMRMHTKDKSYRCDKCTCAYSHSSHLYRHQEAVHLGLVFPCEAPGCQTVFRRRDNYRVHLKKAHTDLDPSFIAELMKKEAQLSDTTK